MTETKSSKNASSAVARMGWEIYRGADPPPSFMEINAELLSRGLVTVRPRTYKHYRSLAYHGCTEYLPVNELDVRVKLGQLS